MFASTCHSLNDKLDEVPLSPEVSNETRKAGSDRLEYVAVGGRHTFKFGKLESLQTRVGVLALLIFAGTIWGALEKPAIDRGKIKEKGLSG